MLFRSPLLETLWPVGADTRCSGSLAARLVPGEGFETGVSRALPSPSPDHPSRGICNRKNWTDTITYTMIPFKEFDHSGLIIFKEISLCRLLCRCSFCRYLHSSGGVWEETGRPASRGLPPRPRGPHMPPSSVIVPRTESNTSGRHQRMQAVFTSSQPPAWPQCGAPP